MKDPSRKAKRAPKREPVEADDLTELAELISEYKLDNNAEGWLLLPWRSGWSVVALCLAIDMKLRGHVIYGAGAPADVDTSLRVWAATREITSNVYFAADNLREGLKDTSPALGCALRCVQVMIARSDGGGAVYNDILKPLFHRLRSFMHVLAPAVMDARCRDAIGVGPNLMNDADDRRRRAFKIAWERGLYHAAYAIPPATKEGT